MAILQHDTVTQKGSCPSKLPSLKRVWYELYWATCKRLVVFWPDNCSFFASNIEMRFIQTHYILRLASISEYSAIDLFKRASIVRRFSFHSANWPKSRTQWYFLWSKNHRDEDFLIVRAVFIIFWKEIEVVKIINSTVRNNKSGTPVNKIIRCVAMYGLIKFRASPRFISPKDG